MPASKAILYGLLGLALVRGLIYGAVTPPWQAPDEPSQFERARAALRSVDWQGAAENGPDWYDQLSDSLFTFHFWDFVDIPRPPYTPEAPLNQYITLYHEAYQGLYGSRPTYGAIGLPLFIAHHQDLTLQLYLVRLNTVLMGVGVIFLAYLITRTLFPHDTFLVLGVPILILFNPQHTHLLSTVNNGNLAELLTTIALLFMVKGTVEGFSWFKVFAIFGFSLAAMWTKATAYFLPFAVGTIGLFYVWKYRRYWRWLAPTGVLLAGLTYYFAPERLKLLIPRVWSSLSISNLFPDPIVPLDLFRSFWAYPGWTILQLHPFWYQALFIACALAMVGLILLLVAKRQLLFSKEFRPKIRALTVLAVATAVAIGILLAWNAVTNVIVYRQGRSIYPVIVPIALFLMLGWRQLIPARRRNFGLLAITSILFLFDSLVLFNYIIPFFYSRY